MNNLFSFYHDNKLKMNYIKTCLGILLMFILISTNKMVNPFIITSKPFFADWMPLNLL